MKKGQKKGKVIEIRYDPDGSKTTTYIDSRGRTIVETDYRKTVTLSSDVEGAAVTVYSDGRVENLTCSYLGEDNEWHPMPNVRYVTSPVLEPAAIDRMERHAENLMRPSFIARLKRLLWKERTPSS